MTRPPIYRLVIEDSRGTYRARWSFNSSDLAELILEDFDARHGHPWYNILISQKMVAPVKEEVSSGQRRLKAIFTLETVYYTVDIFT